MLGILGAFLLVSATTAIGFCIAAENRRAALCAEGYLALVEHIEASLPSLESLESIIAVFENRSLRREGVLEILQTKNSAVPCNKRLAVAIELQREDKTLYEVLLPLSKELGSTDYTKQQRSLAAAKTSLSALCAARRAETERGDGCYKWLGVLAGAMAVILLI